MIWNLLQVAAGGALGSVLRYLVVLGALRAFGAGFPYGTLAVNIAGSLVMGLVFVWLTERDLLRLAPLFMPGLLGGFTTFSAFSLDAWLLWDRGAEGLAIAYAAGSVLASVTALVAGIGIMRWVLG